MPRATKSKRTPLEAARSGPLDRRTSGVLLHLTSLPGPHGSGDLGPAAHRFADFLAESRQSWWQMLPVGPVGCGNSPYQALSAFAGDPLLISLAKLADDGLLDAKDLEPSRDLRRERVGYVAARRFRAARLRKAFAAFEARRRPSERQRLEAFLAENESWLPDFALFSALRDAHPPGSWTAWPEELRARAPAALARARARFAGEIRYHQFLQLEFHRQWSELRAHCRERGVGLIGDVPIFVAHDSADVWAHPRLFTVAPSGGLSSMAGVPPDYFSATGQLWGNPLYRWRVLRARGYDWWIARLRSVTRAFDVARIDHFIGFHRAWALAPGATTAERGRWVRGPGVAFFLRARRALGRLPFIAEDLGLVVPEVKALRDRLDLPGMRVLQFAFGDDPEAESYQPHNYPRRCVVYTGTHDNDTTVGWFHDVGLRRRSTRSAQQIERERGFALRYLGSDGREIHWDLIRLALMSVADTAIIPMQDLLGLGSEARMNLPGTAEGNWEWRMRDEAAADRVGERLARLTETYSRGAEP